MPLGGGEVHSAAPCRSRRNPALRRRPAGPSGARGRVGVSRRRKARRGVAAKMESLTRPRRAWQRATMARRRARPLTSSCLSRSRSATAAAAQRRSAAMSSTTVAPAVRRALQRHVLIGKRWSRVSASTVHCVDVDALALQQQRARLRRATRRREVQRRAQAESADWVRPLLMRRWHPPIAAAAAEHRSRVSAVICAAVRHACRHTGSTRTDERVSKSGVAGSADPLAPPALAPRPLRRPFRGAGDQLELDRAVRVVLRVILRAPAIAHSLTRPRRTAARARERADEAARWSAVRRRSPLRRCCRAARAAPERARWSPDAAARELRYARALVARLLGAQRGPARRASSPPSPPSDPRGPLGGPSRGDRAHRGRLRAHPRGIRGSSRGPRRRRACRRCAHRNRPHQPARLRGGRRRGWVDKISGVAADDAARAARSLTRASAP